MPAARSERLRSLPVLLGLWHPSALPDPWAPPGRRARPGLPDPWALWAL